MSKVTELSTKLFTLQDQREALIHWVDECSLYLDRDYADYRRKNELNLQRALVLVDIKNMEIEIEMLSERLYKNEAENQVTEPSQILLKLSQLFIPKEAQEYALGDVTEKFDSDVEKSGERKAKLNLVKNIASSICPFIWGFVRAKFEKLVGRVER